MYVLRTYVRPSKLDSHVCKSAEAWHWSEVWVCNVPDFDSHYGLCITVWESNSGKFLGS